MKKLTKKIRKVVLLPIRKIQYGSFGIKSDILKPLMIEGKSNIFISNNTFIREFARIEAITYYCGTKFTPRLSIGERVTIEQGVHISCADCVSIGDNTTISSYVYISDLEHKHDLNTNVFDIDLDVNPVCIGSHVFIGTGAKILKGVTIGNNSIIGANAVVNKDIPSNCIAVGVPAKVIKRYDISNKKWRSIK